MDEQILQRKLQELNQKFEIHAEELGQVDPGTDGLVPAVEGGAVVAGLIGGKGTLPDGTDINDVDHGGVYYLPAENTYKNVPFVANTGNYRMQLTVIRNYGQNPWTTDPLIYHRVETVELSGEIKVAYRFRYLKWLDWYYPEGFSLWSGSQYTDGSTLTMARPITDFSRIKIYWEAYSRGVVVSEEVTNTEDLSLAATNMPNDTSQTVGSVEEVLLHRSSDGMTLTATGNLFYMQDGGVSYSPENSKKSRIIEIIGYPKR